MDFYTLTDALLDITHYIEQAHSLCGVPVGFLRTRGSVPKGIPNSCPECVAALMPSRLNFSLRDPGPKEKR